MTQQARITGWHRASPRLTSFFAANHTDQQKALRSSRSGCLGPQVDLVRDVLRLLSCVGMVGAVVHL